MCEAVTSCVEWMRLGLELGLKYSTLREIEIERHQNVHSCRIDMIASWLGKKDKVIKKGGPKWKQIIKALRDINEIGLGEKIYEEITRRQKVSNPMKPDNEKEEMTSKRKRKIIESSSHKSKKHKLESSDVDERSVTSKVRGKGPASGKPYKRKRVPKNNHDTSNTKSKHYDSDSEPSSKRTHKR